ncbi:MAG: hypothetical protein ACRYF0_14405 [Janthinobacterium lividum]
MRKLLLPLFLLGAATASAQTNRQVRATQLWPELQGELALHNGDYLLLGLRGERAAASGDFAGRSLGFDTRRARLGYEHFGSGTWSYGATLQVVGDGRTIVIPEVLLRHRSPVIGGITFGQRLSLERSFGGDGSYALGSGPEKQLWTRLRVDLEKLVPLGAAANGLALRPRLSYEASTHLRLQKDALDPDERTVQYTNLRAEVGVRLLPQLDITPWFGYQTSYFVSVPQYDVNMVQVRGGKENYVYPTVGLDVRFTLLSTGAKADRQQLPTQH